MAHLPTTTGTASADETATTASPRAKAQPSKATQIGDALRKRAIVLSRLLGGERLADRFCRAAMAHWSAMANQSPKDRERLERVDPESFASACQAAALDRLTPDGRDGWIVVRGDGTASWTPSYRGLIQRFRRAVKDAGGKAIAPCAEIVYREEIAAGGFEVDLAARTIAHRPWYLLGIEIEPLWESVQLVYAAVTVVDADGDTTREFRVLTIAEINQRARMSGNPLDDEWSAAWTRWPRSMAKGKAWRALMDWMPRPDDLELDDGGAGSVAEVDVPQRRVAAAVVDRVRALDAAADGADADPHGAIARDAEVTP